MGELFEMSWGVIRRNCQFLSFRTVVDGIFPVFGARNGGKFRFHDVFGERNVPKQKRNILS